MNLYSLLEASFPADRDTICLEVPRGHNRTWREIDHTCAKMANWLASLDLPTGARVATTVEKSPEALMLYLATLRAGYVFLPLNTAYRDSELAYFFGNAKPSVVVCSEQQLNATKPLAAQASVKHCVTLNDDGTGSLIDAIESHQDHFETVEVSDEALASILYTSGTTGRSKGAMLSHGNLGSNAMELRTCWGWSREDVLLHMLPIFHIHGLFVAANGALLAGAKMIWLPKFDVLDSLTYLPHSTLMMGVPTYYVRLLSETRFDRQVCRNIRLFVSGSAPLQFETFVEFEQRIGCKILERYGMSETGILASNPYHERDGHRLGGTVGRPMPSVSLRIVDGEGKPCCPGEVGSIEVRGQGVFQGYWEMPEKTLEEFTDDGYFRTGDLGQFGGEIAGHAIPDDYLSIVGRGKDLIISGGFNVYPKEIEGYIDELPGVLESAVIGIPHPDFGEVGMAVVVPKPECELDVIEIQMILKSKIANFKVPKRIVIAADLPRNTMGKVQKSLLREQYALTRPDK